MPLILILILLHQFSGYCHSCASVISAKVSSLIWVTQTEDQADGVVGGSITLSCQIHSDTGDDISQCIAQWYVQELPKWREVRSLNHLKERIINEEASSTSATLTIKELTENDTDSYFCTLICNINGKRKQHHGNGTKINIRDRECLPSKIPDATTTALPEPDGKDDEDLLPVPFYGLLALKLVAALLIVTFSVMCPKN